MAGYNEGDIIEGIFAISIALYIRDDKIDKNKLNDLRTKIEPIEFDKGRVLVNIAKNVKKQYPGKPVDLFNVNLEIRLKRASTGVAFGKDFKPIYSKSKDIGNIDKKIDSLIKSQNNSSWQSKIKAAKDKFLMNNISEVVTFNVIADGIAGESSGGDIKADIVVEIYAQTKTQKKSIFKEKISFSLKSESVTVANLSPYKGMKDIAEAFKLDWKDVSKYEVLTRSAKTETEKIQKFKTIEAMYAELKGMIKKNKSTISQKAFDFLGKSIFGSDLANVVDIQKSVVKEISPEYFNLLKKNIKLDVIENGNNLVFVDEKTKTPIFQIRTKLRKEANEAKFYLEVGKGIYNK